MHCGSCGESWAIATTLHLLILMGVLEEVLDEKTLKRLHVTFPRIIFFTLSLAHPLTQNFFSSAAALAPLQGGSRHACRLFSANFQCYAHGSGSWRVKA